MKPLVNILIKYDTRVRLQLLYYPMLFLFNYNMAPETIILWSQMALLGVIFPVFLSRPSEILKYYPLYSCLITIWRC